MLFVLWEVDRPCGLNYMRSGRGLHRFQQFLPALPGIVVGFFVGVFSGGILACPHESVACAFVGHRIIFLAGFLHRVLGCGNCRIDARVVAAIESVDRRLDLSHIVRWWSVKYKRCCEIRTICRKPEALSATPAEAGSGQLPT